ncbi:MAG: hypothetical protein DCC58_03725 [Chloroflexi bacterium]|nr:MAG: hypothetical protein DCC58_03725 [Chloroflexota bacterium]
MALPAVRALAEALPQRRIDVYVGDHARLAFELSGLDVHILSVPPTFDLARAMRLRYRLKRQYYESIVILDRSRWLRLAASRAAPQVVAARSQQPERRHESVVYLDVVRATGVDALPAPPKIVPPDALHSTIAAPYTILHPGGGQNPGAFLPRKRWDPTRWIEVARALVAQGFAVFLTGNAEEAPIAERIADSVGANTTSIAGKLTLRESAELICGARLFVGPDTGLAHIAAAAGIPTVAIFGPTNPNRYRPLGSAVRICAPPASWELTDRDLRRHTDVPSECDIMHVHVDEVLAAVADLLGEHPCG